MSQSREEPPPKRRNLSPGLNEERFTADRDNLAQPPEQDNEAQSLRSSSSSNSNSSQREQAHHSRTTTAGAGEGVDVEEETSSSGTDDSDEASGSQTEIGEDDEDGDDGENEEASPFTAPDILTAASRQPTSLPASGESSDLKSRLQSFLPQLQKANVELETSSDVMERRIDYVADDAEQYIEMNLGLGVLSEKRPGEEDEVRLNPSSSDVESEASSSEERPADNSTEDRPVEDVLARLKGEKVRKATKRKVQELG